MEKWFALQLFSRTIENTDHSSIMPRITKLACKITNKKNDKRRLDERRFTFQIVKGFSTSGGAIYGAWQYLSYCGSIYRYTIFCQLFPSLFGLL